MADMKHTARGVAVGARDTENKVIGQVKEVQRIAGAIQRALRQDEAQTKQLNIADPHKITANSRYLVSIDGLSMAVFSEVGGLQIETELFEYAEGGNTAHTYRLPGQTKAGNITLKRGVVKGNELYKWYENIIRGSMDLRKVTITLADTALNALVVWELQQAFPCKWSGPQMTIGSESVAVESVELAHSGLITVS